MAAPILWAPGKIAFFLQENLHARKIPRFRGGGILGFGGGGGVGSADFIFMAARIFPKNMKIGNFNPEPPPPADHRHGY